MKRVISFALATVFLLGICSCSGGKAPEKATLTKEMLTGKTFTSGRLEVTAEEDPEASFTLEKDSIVDWDDSGYFEVYWSISDDRVLFTEPIGSSSSYLYRDGYLVAENSCIASNGVIPDGDTFKATITVGPSLEVSIKIVFNFEEDGTYTCKVGDDLEEGTRYAREGNLIKLYDTNSHGEEVIIMYLYYAGENEIYNMVLFPEE